MKLSAREKEEGWKKEIVTPRVGVGGIVESPDRKSIVIIERKFPPYGYAMPGGMSELGETIEETAIREIKEETGLDAEVIGLLNISSAPELDPRWHVVVPHVIMRVKGDQEPKANDDAKSAFWMKYDSDELLDSFTEMCKPTLKDYREWRKKEGGLSKLR